MPAPGSVIPSKKSAVPHPSRMRHCLRSDIRQTPASGLCVRQNPSFDALNRIEPCVFYRLFKLFRAVLSVWKSPLFERFVLTNMIDLMGGFMPSAISNAPTIRAIAAAAAAIAGACKTANARLLTARWLQFHCLSPLRIFGVDLPTISDAQHSNTSSMPRLPKRWPKLPRRIPTKTCISRFSLPLLRPSPLP